MQWVKVDTLSFDDSTTLTLDEIREVESELNPDCIPPIRIDINGKILEGLSRYLVLLKWEFEEVPVVRDNKRSKIYLSKAAISEESYMLAA